MRQAHLLAMFVTILPAFLHPVAASGTYEY